MPRAELVASLAVGFITKERAEEIAAEYPEVISSIAGWIREAAAREDWRMVERFANLAAPLAPPGVGEVLRELLDADIDQLNNEDVVDILGELRAVEAASSLFRAVERSLESDAPAYWLCQKAIGSLRDLETDEANDYLRTLTAATWPGPIRWYAAEALQIEDELGFAEDQMLG
ncbi:hypothetical protein E1263_26970 [Kribbella antibiotica]|uniref:HEAT repeat domain-containing protein n=1 Tax=Kribbella antibiotica TaxID=190195 RepID=A0A4V2YNI5_9ACTN|nr:hypothetical protein [Kribbella antibiotica]TDD54487.1 hypothetical protein E1263_26970 [Kribbella antibiotica]